MRKTTQKMVAAFFSGKNYKGQNTEVIHNENAAIPCSQIYLFGNLIAEQNDKGLFIQNCGWFSNTTKERLNALPNVHITQKDFQWYLNGELWSGNWTQVLIK